MTVLHKTLEERWARMSLAEQMGNIGSEVSRAAFFLKKDDREKCLNSAARGLELFDFSIKAAQQNKRRGALKELTRSRDIFCEIFFEMEHAEEIQSFQAYFDQFALAARK